MWEHGRYSRWQAGQQRTVLCIAGRSKTRGGLASELMVMQTYMAEGTVAKSTWILGSGGTAHVTRNTRRRCRQSISNVVTNAAAKHSNCRWAIDQPCYATQAMCRLGNPFPGGAIAGVGNNTRTRESNSFFRRDIDGGSISQHLPTERPLGRGTRDEGRKVRSALAEKGERKQRKK